MQRRHGPLSGTTLGDGYALGDLTAYGDDGDYYRAVRGDLEVSVLVTHPWLAEGVSAAQYSSELARWPEAEHPAIARVLDLGQDGDALFVVTEALGASLADTIYGGALDVAPAVALGLRVADALGAIHAAGGLHGGLNVRCVFLPDDGDVARARILPRSLRPRGIEGPWSVRSVTMYGAPPYLADDTFGGALDTRSDLAALALALYEALAGGLFRSDQPMYDVMRRYFEGTMDDLRSRRPAVPEALAVLIARTISPNRDARPQTAEALREALRAVPR